MKCHITVDHSPQLGPELFRSGEETTSLHLVEALLHPSRTIKKDYETIKIETMEGKTVSGLLVSKSDESLVVRDMAKEGKQTTFAMRDVDRWKLESTSIMPEGLVNLLANRQEFYDLVRYLREIADGGPKRALQLRPPASLYAVKPLPPYESDLDHAGLIRDLNRDSFRRGQEIYTAHCANCHGTHDQVGSLPTSLRFASEVFKSGNDPHTMYRTLTHGYGMMVAQGWMVPQQKYDVIHYIREAYLKPSNPNQYFEVTPEYLAGVPKGKSRGPKPSNQRPWTAMDYGPTMNGTFEIGNDGKNFAYKGIAVRLDSGPGGISKGEYWMLYDHDTMRVAAAWSGRGFIDWKGIHFNGAHNIHPRIVGQVHFQNRNGPGWADPRRAWSDSSFDDVRLVGRDERRYGPLPREWAHFKGMYHYGDRAIVDYTVGETTISEMPGIQTHQNQVVFTRAFNIGPRDRDLVLQVADLSGHEPIQKADQPWVIAGAAAKRPVNSGRFRFAEGRHLRVDSALGLDLDKKDYSIVARIKTKKDGTILSQASSGEQWLPNGKTFFIRGGRLAVDVGWVGVVHSKTRVDDGKWHDVAMTWRARDGQVTLLVDGKTVGQGNLLPKEALESPVVRIGYTSENFPATSPFTGEMKGLRIYRGLLPEGELAQAMNAKPSDRLIADWLLQNIEGERVVDRVGKFGAIVAGPEIEAETKMTLAAVSSELKDAKWDRSEANHLRLTLPAGEKPLRFTLFVAGVADPKAGQTLAANLPLDDATLQLAALKKGGSGRWNEALETKPIRGDDQGPFAVDVLVHPNENPWNCRARLTGLDFYADDDQAAVCAWDGSIWHVRGLRKPEGPLVWKRIASGLFQPLGLRIIDEKIHVICRDQLAILHDVNGDGEIDHYQNFNNDHQVTEHFHEFAMGLQTDDEGNFYYAKSARHAKTALVPHHGTLLKISKDGLKTTILANGFRAANGVCLNPDGSFIVTDQEGHWNPKNRINWVKPGGFYGNMFGYHDVTDSSDEAMEPPLCWITNSFDRSPAELLWVNGPARWGALNGTLLNFSYGYGKIYVVPYEQVEGQMQGGMCEIPITPFPTGIMRGRFHPGDGQLYCCGMFAWAGSQQQPGGFYRVRYTGKPVHLPIGLNATKTGMRIQFSGELDREAATNPDHYALKVWGLKRTANYGSKHYNEREIEVERVELADDGKSVTLVIPDLKPTWCMEIKYSLKSREKKPVNGMIHNTIHRLK